MGYYTILLISIVGSEILRARAVSVLFKFYPYFYSIINKGISGPQGKVWADDPDNPKAAMSGRLMLWA